MHRLCPCSGYVRCRACAAVEVMLGIVAAPDVEAVSDLEAVQL